MDGCKGYGRIVYVDSQEEADRLMEEEKNLPSLEELYKQRAELDKRIFEANMRLGFPNVYLVDNSDDKYEIHKESGDRNGKR